MTCEGLGQRLRNIENPQTTVPPQPRLVISGFACDPSADLGDLVVADALLARKVNVVTSNAIAEIPQGVLGIVYSKESSTNCSILIRGLTGGYSGLTSGSPLFCSPTGTLTHIAPPAPGMSHRLGTAISPAEIIFDPHTPFRRPN